MAVPFVGIFWGVPVGTGLKLVTDSSPLSRAEPYGTFLTHAGGHYEVWERLRQLTPSDLARAGVPALVQHTEYEEFPRGRIVYETREGIFIIYADWKLQRPSVMSEIVAAFGLGDHPTIIRSDPHFRT